MNILLIDDHALFREGLCLLLNKIENNIVVYESETLNNARVIIKKTPIDLILLDLGLTESRGIETLQLFRASIDTIPIIVLSGEQDSTTIRLAIDAGAIGFIPKTHTLEQMITALRFMLSGGIYLPSSVLHLDRLGLASQARSGNAPTDPFSHLSSRQLEISQMMLQGYTNKAIAQRLDISEGTVKAHISAIFQIIGAKNRVEAVLVAAKSGFKVK
jgi:DNA-binding NarL/FixJ family response regulator